MAQSKIRWWESGRNLGFAGTVVAALVAAGLLAAFETVRKWASVLWHAAVYPVPVPLVLLIAMVALLVVASLGVLKRAAAPAPPPFLKYWQDVFLGVKWRWTYHSDHTFSSSSLTPFCPQCGVAVRIESGYHRAITIVFVCDECGFRQEIEGNAEAVFARVRRLIVHQLEQRYTGQS